MQNFIELDPKIKAWVQGVPVADNAIEQLKNIAQLPILGGHVAVMPDVHLGMGATVGSVIPTRFAIIPAAVGVDIGCGMMAVRTNLKGRDLPESLKPIRRDIEKAVPVGFNFHKSPVIENRDGLLPSKLVARAQVLAAQFDRLSIMTAVRQLNEDRMWAQLGTLGGGNHFIEVCLSDDDDVWVMLHSGSRNVGKTFAEVAIAMAKEAALKQSYHLPDLDLAWLDEGTREFDMYTEALLWAQDYAALNRQIMMALVLNVMRKHFGKRFATEETAINCHHNYAQRERHFGRDLWITRKGAVSAAKGTLGIIPGSMGARSYIVRGQGNEQSYCSCSHGAGRVYSRTQAKKRYSIEDLKEQTRGVECRKDNAVIDEIPAAYKDIDAVMAAQKDLVEVVAVLKQVLCVKG